MQLVVLDLRNRHAAEIIVIGLSANLCPLGGGGTKGVGIAFRIKKLS